MILFDLIFYTHTPTENAKDEKQQIGKVNHVALKKDEEECKNAKQEKVKEKCIIVKKKTKIDIYT